METERGSLTEVRTADVALGDVASRVNGEEVHIALFLPSLVSGGAERVMLNIAEGLASQGVRVDLVLSSARGDYLSQVPEGVRVVDLKSRRVIRSLFKLARYLRKEQPSVLLSALAHTNLVALWARALSLTDTKVVVAVHSTLSLSTKFSPRRRDRLVPWLTHMFYRQATHVVAVSRGSADDLIRLTRLDPDLVEVIPNPVITERLFEKARQPVDQPWLVEHENPVIITVGRLTAAKNYGLLLEAFARVRATVDARLIMLGDGEERAFLEEMIRALGLSPYVSMPGFVENPWAYMSKSDAFVLSSRWEGLPTVLVEALALGLRVVSTDCDYGPRELLKDGRFGMLVPVGDADALAAAMIEVLDQPAPDVSLADLSAFRMESAVRQYKELLLNGAR